MGKLIEKNTIDAKNNINTLVENSSICKKICSIEKESNYSDVEKKVNGYYCATKGKGDLSLQIGRVWILVKENKINQNREILQVAQALEEGKGKGFWDEIFSHIDEICNEKIYEKHKFKYGELKKGLNNDESLSFYEIEIDEYLKIYAPNNYKDIIYNMAKEYFVEASIAHFAQAREWGFYTSGMDKRAYFYLLENMKATEIDKQK